MADRVCAPLAPKDQVDPRQVAWPIDCGHTAGSFVRFARATKVMPERHQKASSPVRAGWSRGAGQGRTEGQGRIEGQGRTERHGWIERLNGRHPLCLVDPSPRHWSASGLKAACGRGGVSVRWTR
jgi:hypothetical protein